MALVNQQAAIYGSPSVGFANPKMYAIAATSAYSTTFHDVVSGCTPNGGGGFQYCAETGYDLTTGLGSPQSSLINALLTCAGEICCPSGEIWTGGRCTPFINHVPPPPPPFKCGNRPC
jgi:hypothetical protein